MIHSPNRSWEFKFDFSDSANPLEIEDIRDSIKNTVRRFSLQFQTAEKKEYKQTSEP